MSYLSTQHTTQTWLIKPEQTGQRLDKALAIFLPESSLRTRRRLCESGLVYLNGKIANAAVKVQTEQTLTIYPPLQKTTPSTSTNTHLEILHQDTDFVVVHKPIGIHTVSLSGSSTPSLEQTILQTFTTHYSEITILNRLDKETSGLIVVALSENAIDHWRKAENRGKIEKDYLALIEGVWVENYTIQRVLDTANRRITRVRHHNNPDQRRHTQVNPLNTFEPGTCPYLNDTCQTKCTLVQCTIKQGARHQIRAHLAAAGHPLVYDTLYGSTLSPTPEKTFFLKNTHLKTPFFELESIL